MLRTKDWSSLPAMKTVALFLILVLAGCSGLDPNVGPPYVQPPSVSDGGGGGDVETDGDDIDPNGVSFARDIRPILLRSSETAKAMDAGRGCVPCHDGKAASHTGASLSGFDLSTLGELRKGGGYTGPRIIVPGKPTESALVQALRGQIGSNRMPKGGPYHDDKSDEMRLITTWIAEGAKGNPNE